MKTVNGYAQPPQQKKQEKWQKAFQKKLNL